MLLQTAGEVLRRRGNDREGERVHEGEEAAAHGSEKHIDIPEILGIQVGGTEIGGERWQALHTAEEGEEAASREDTGKGGDGEARGKCREHRGPADFEAPL